MAWAELAYSRSQVKRAGKQIVDPATSAADREEARRIVNNWRSVHGYPLNTFQMNLRRHARSAGSVLVAQRTKRLPSIVRKLERSPNMDLTQMQDVAGCRAVVPTVEDVRATVAAHQVSRSQHELVKVYDYMDGTPAASGYRSVHLVYKHVSDARPDLNGLRVEVQVRTNRQHEWATAVESAGFFLRRALKASEGDPRWLRFFALMGGELAAMEGTSPVPEVPTDERERQAELRAIDADLRVIAKLSGFNSALSVTESPGSDLDAAVRFYLLNLDVGERALTVTGITDRRTAQSYYDDAEVAYADNPLVDVVLVSVKSLDELRRAYPNYFADTSAFIRVAAAALGRS